MPRITRKQQKIFAVDAANNGVFGSLQANDPTYSTDPDAIQGRPAYSSGWNDATYSAELLPPLEEFQGLQYLFSRQLSYIFQEGVPEWNSSTTYYEGSIVKLIDNGKTCMYLSLIDNNTNNNVSDTTKWLCFFDSTSIYANNSFNNITTGAKNIATWSTNVSNCITEIPQDIKLELNDGTLTLKAGSKVYVPNGFEQDGTTKKFDVVTVENDASATETTNNTFIILYYPNGNYIVKTAVSNCASGSSQPSLGNYGFWYDTTNNLIKRYVSGSFDNGGYSLPVAIVTVSGGVITSIDQVFNGFGYIGSTIFALPGVKGLIPNGRNEDGTLKNTEMTIYNVITYDFSNYNSKGMWLGISSTGVMASNSFVSQEENPKTTYTTWYRPSENISYYSSNTTTFSKLNYVVFGQIDRTAGTTMPTLSNFKPKTVFHSFDYNDFNMLLNVNFIKVSTLPANSDPNKFYYVLES